MTEEDQKLVALAALHGCRFRRFDIAGGYRNMWSYEGSKVSKWTIGRAAEFYLYKHGLRSEPEHSEYDIRTERDTLSGGEDVDPAFLASVLS